MQVHYSKQRQLSLSLSLSTKKVELPPKLHEPTIPGDAKVCERAREMPIPVSEETSEGRSAMLLAFRWCRGSLDWWGDQESTKEKERKLTLCSAPGGQRVDDSGRKTTPALFLAADLPLSPASTWYPPNTRIFR